ncbi:MBL fold metallo-hydrolase [Candidatus Parcubacteria bacterium]|nr:MBL fold metallo-hydrolase [Candidatus Parcubacteria bacterium]
MKITKIGHCCLLVEEKELRILTDPGTYSDGQNEIKNIDIVLITHEHADHFHIDSLKIVLSNNPQAKVITNTAVGNLLDKEKIPYEKLEHGGTLTVKETLLEGFGEKHGLIYKTIPPVQNTGFFIANRLFYPGDAFINPQKPVEILALPIAGPWMKISEAIDYALEVAPKIAFPVHDGILKNPGMMNRLPPQILEPKGIKFAPLDLEKEYEF